MNPRKAMKANPFMLPKAVCRAAEAGRKRRLRSAVLTGKAARLYRCLSFAMNQYGVIMNGHMTVAWEVLGIRDHVRAAVRPMPAQVAKSLTDIVPRGFSSC